MTGANGTNGHHPHGAPTAPLATTELDRIGPLDRARVRRLLEGGRAQAARQLAEARLVADRAAEVIAQKLAELRYFDKLLAVAVDPAPPPPWRLGRGTRGGGIGKRAGVFILEVAKERYTSSGDATFSARVMNVACKGWPERTIGDGITRLLEDGLIRRTSVGHYEVTALGLAQAPAAAGELPLLPPREPAEATP